MKHYGVLIITFTYALKEAHPSNYINQHVNLHKFVEAEFELV